MKTKEEKIIIIKIIKTIKIITMEKEKESLSTYKNND